MAVQSVSARSGASPFFSRSGGRLPGATSASRLRRAKQGSARASPAPRRQPRLIGSESVIPYGLRNERVLKVSKMTDTTTSARRPMGRPRDERADRAILSATLELMAEHGVDGLRTDDVADRAKVGKATIYRRYRSKEELVAAAVGALVTRSPSRTRV